MQTVSWHEISMGGMLFIVLDISFITSEIISSHAVVAEAWEI